MRKCLVQLVLLVSTASRPVHYFSLSFSGKDFDFTGLPENHNQSQNRLQALESRGHEQTHSTLSPAAKPVETSAILILFIT